MKHWILLLLSALVFLLSCANSQNITEQEREAIRRSNENYRRMQTH